MSDQLLKEVLNEVKGLKSEVNELKNEQQELKVEQRLMNTQINENTQLIKVVLDRQEEADAKLTAMREDMTYMKGEITDTRERIDYFGSKVLQHDEDIFKFKSRVNL